MMEENNDEKILLPHHEQQPLCTTRLPYRQGRKLTAVKVYTINSESNHLLIFGVPALNLRQEAKALFHKFGKLKLFTITKEHKAEQFTETYHTVFDRIQSARMAKKMLDTKNFYGGSLHVTYAPELESLEETRIKLAQRKYDVLARLKNLQNEEVPVVEKVELVEEEKVAPKLNMGEENIIQANGLVRKRKYKHEGEKFKPCFISNEDNQESDSQKKTTKIVENVPGNIQNMVEKENSNVEIVDCTSVNVETITNINEHLNVDRFDNIRIYKVPEKPVNKIKFNEHYELRSATPRNSEKSKLLTQPYDINAFLRILGVFIVKIPPMGLITLTHMSNIYLDVSATLQWLSVHKLYHIQIGRPALTPPEIREPAFPTEMCENALEGMFFIDQ